MARDSVESAAQRVLAAAGMYFFIAPFETGSRSIAEVAAYLTQNGYHRLYRDEMLVETADFASMDGGRPATMPVLWPVR